jgi:hypothetical protein
MIAALGSAHAPRTIRPLFRLPTTFRLWSLLFVLTSIASCGADPGSPNAGSGSATGGDGAACGAVPACGGDIVGRWNMTDSCVTGDLELDSDCGATANVDFSFDEGITYNADLTYTQTGSIRATAHYHLPPACVGNQSCAQVQAGLMSTGAAVGTGFTLQSVVCRGSIACTCDAIITSSPMDQNGTYNTVGGLLLVFSVGSSSITQYCVTGTTMHEMIDSNTEPSGTLIFTKQ